MTKPRQIVPLVQAGEMAELAPATKPHLTHHGGPVLSNVEVFTIFWGAAWQQPAQIALIGQLNNFFDTILKSSLIDVLAQYHTATQKIGQGTRVGTTTITSPQPGTLLPSGRREVSDSDIQTVLQGWIKKGAVPPNNSNTLYFVYLPPNVVSVLGSQKSCSNFCGYHSHIGGTIFYAVEPFITCAGCTFGQIFDSLTKVSSHELCEAITDPALNGWFDNTAGDEIGDICNTDVRSVDGFTVQAEWSNADNACVIAPGGGLHDTR